MKLYIARHGETDWNLMSKIQGQTDTSLNHKGRKQAEELAEKLLRGNYQIDYIYSSRQKRALETAQIIGKAIGVEPVIRSGLEEMNFGEWEGYSWPQVETEFSQEYQYWQRNRRYTQTPGGESYQQVLDRLLPVLRETVQNKTGNVLILTHSAVIKALLSYIYDTPFEKMAKNYRTPNAEIIELGEQERGRL